MQQLTRNVDSSRKLKTLEPRRAVDFTDFVCVITDQDVDASNVETHETGSLDGQPFNCRTELHRSD